MKHKTKYTGLLIERKPNDEEGGEEAKNRLIFTLMDINRKTSLKDLYEALNCDTIDIQVRYINGKAYDFIFDDEYLLKDKSREPSNCIALGNREGKILEAIYGALFICGLADEQGAETSLTNKDILNILEHGRTMAENKKNGEKYEVMIYNFEDETKAKK